MPNLPSPPPDCPPAIAAELPEYNPDELRAIAQYAATLAESGVTQSEDQEPADDDQTDVEDDLPDDVPSKATVVTKTINDNRYYYWQWRDGDTITSKYKAPVDPGS